MITDIRFSQEFERAFKQLKKKYPSLKEDFKKFLQALIKEPLQGAELTPEIRKIRMAISSKKKGKSGGARVIVRVVLNQSQLSVLYIYDKSDMESISDLFIADILKRMSDLA